MERTLRLFAVACFCFIGVAAQAQVQETVKIDNATVSVTSLTGHINFAMDPKPTRLSFPNKSFFSIKIGDQVFTNNDQVPQGAMTIGLANVERSGDTITSMWQVATVRVTQIVEPRVNVQSKLVPTVRYFVTNLSTEVVAIQPQYLLDISIGKSDGREYGNWGGNSVYSQTWSMHTSSIPDRTTFGEREFAPPTFDQGTLAELSFDQGMFALPTVLLFGDWSQLENKAFIDPALSLPTTMITDLGVVMQWRAESLTPGETKEVAIFAYGPSNNQPASVEEDLSSGVRVFPNPVSNALSVRCDGTLDSHIQNMLGQTVWSGLLEGASSIDVGQLAPGSYFLVAEGKATPFVVSR